MEWTELFQSKIEDYAQEDQWTLQFDRSIVPNQPDDGWLEYKRSTCGRFRCSICGRTWPSNRVMVFFHMRLNKKTHRGTIKVRRFCQNCKKCTDPPMENPKINTENIEILMESLVKNIRKRFYHEDFGGGPRGHAGVPVKSPHEPSNCEGCINGVCGNNVDGMTDAFHNLSL